MNSVQSLFLTVLNMSITASYVAVAVILVRALLKRTPKVFAYALWSVVLFRLVCPISIPLPFSMLGAVDALVPAPAAANPPSDALSTAPLPVISTGLSAVDNAVNRALPAATPAASVDPMQVVVGLASLIWILGIALILVYSALTYIKMQRRLQTATRLADNIFETDQIGTAFVCGFFRPRIFVPVGLKQSELAHILEHERAHIRRRDHIIKPLAFLAMTVHWFNPLMWLSFALMSRDMEMSCDEAVLSSTGDNERFRYSGSLLALSTRSSTPMVACPLAFSESDVKERIKNVITYKKPGLWITLLAALTVLIAVITMAGNPRASFDIDKHQTQAMQFTSTRIDPLDVGEMGIMHYYTSFMGKDIPKEYRMNSYTITGLSLLAGDEREFAVAVTADYSAASLYFLSANGDFRPVGDGYECTGDYKEFRIKKVGEGSYRIVSIGTGGSTQGLLPVGDDGIANFVENQLAIIMSSPQEASNVFAYIQAHAEDYEKIIKLGGEEALSYMLSEFAAGNVDGLRGALMLELCKDLLGPRNNVTDDTLSPQEWYRALSIRQEVALPDFVYDGHPDGPKDSGRDLAMYLAYSHEQIVYSAPNRGFTVVAIHSHGNHAEGDRLKIFITTFAATYRLYGDVLEMTSGSVVPAALTFYMPSQGVPQLLEYQQARDGSEWSASIREMSQFNGRDIPGMADSIFAHYRDYSDLITLQHQNLRQHLLQNGIRQATYTNSRGEVVLRIP